MTEKMTRLTRRDLMRTAGTLSASVLFAPAIIRAANAQSKFDWKRFAGQKIDVLYVKNTRADMLVAKNKEFEALTGIQVSAEAIPEQQQRQKVTIEFTSGKPTFDVVALSLHVQKRIAQKGKWLTDLKPFMADGSLTSPDLDFADIGQAGLNFSTQNDGSARHHAEVRRLLDPLLQQGAVRAERRRLSEDDGRDRHGGRRS